MPDFGEGFRFGDAVGERVAVGFDEVEVERDEPGDALQLGFADEGAAERDEMGTVGVEAGLVLFSREVVADDGDAFERG